MSVAARMKAYSFFIAPFLGGMIAMEAFGHPGFWGFCLGCVATFAADIWKYGWKR